MKLLPKNIFRYLQSNKLASVCFVDAEGKPYCINCFYYFCETNQVLVFKSSPTSVHRSFIQNKSFVAGTILPKSLNFLKLQGAQFRGELLDNDQIIKHDLEAKYSKKHPISLAMSGYIWAVELQQIKLTDRRVGFGKDVMWENN